MFFCQPAREAAGSDDVTAEEPQEPVRTASHPAVPSMEAIEMLKRGNQRYIEGAVAARSNALYLRQALATKGQNPMAAVISCADSRCPIELLFDAQPGDLFVLRNAGNTCTHGEGSIVGSLEYCTGHLRTNLVLVLGHTKCGAIAGATKTMLAGRDAPKPKDQEDKRPSALQVLLQSLGPVAEQAQAELPQGATAEEIAAHAVKVNVIHTMDRLMEYSEPLRERLRRREVQVHGAIYDLTSGRVDFIGQSPNLGRLADSTAPPPPVPARYLEGKDSEATPPPPPPPAAVAARPKGGVTSRMQKWCQHLRA
mmetsp:Transcript_34354/g.98189  ORF Transcript_34354/g.98189 Transcript_34354/m.98189 type:complete len:310 (-) Transcript_34354:319-1248(-)